MWSRRMTTSPIGLLVVVGGVLVPLLVVVVAAFVVGIVSFLVTFFDLGIRILEASLKFSLIFVPKFVAFLNFNDFYISKSYSYRKIMPI